MATKSTCQLKLAWRRVVVTSFMQFPMKVYHDRASDFLLQTQTKTVVQKSNAQLNTHLPQKQLQHELLAHSSATGRSAFTLTEVKSLAHNGLACTIQHGRILDFTLVIYTAFMIVQSLCVHFLASFLFRVIPWERGLSDRKESHVTIYG